jgi:hypothetical protein
MLPNICSRYEEYDASESNSATAEASLTENIPMTTLGASWASSTATWLTLTSIVLLGSNRNRVGSTCRCSCLGTSAWVGALIGKMTLLATGIALSFRLHWVLSAIGPLNILIPSSRSLEIVGALNNLTLRGREPLSSWQRPRLKL